METYDLIAQENESFDHFNTGWLFMKQSQKTSDAWAAVLERDLKQVSRDQNNFNEVRLRADRIAPLSADVLHARRYLGLLSFDAARRRSLVISRALLPAQAPRPATEKAASRSSPTLSACRESKSTFLSPPCFAAIILRPICLMSAEINHW